jgi:hypothetical protein
MGTPQKRLSLDQLLDEGKKVYVVNNSRKVGLLLIVQMKDKHGGNHALKIPPTKIPICVSDQFSADSIRESTDLKIMIQKQNLSLVEPVDAEKILGTAEAMDEMKALNMSIFSDSAPKNAVRDALEKLKNNSNPEAAVEAAKLLQNKNTLENAVSDKVRGMISSFKSKEKSSKDTLVALRRIDESLSEADLTYIISQCKDETTLRDFAESTLAKKSAAPENPFGSDASEE